MERERLFKLIEASAKVVKEIAKTVEENAPIIKELLTPPDKRQQALPQEDGQKAQSSDPPDGSVEPPVVL